MTQKDKELLLVDLCSRLPYGVKFHYTKHPQSNIDQDCDGTAIGYYCNLIVSANDKDFCVDRCKLYLRPMSNMTEEERKEWKQLLDDEDFARPFYHDDNSIEIWINRDSEYDLEIDFRLIVETIDWLNAHHFDYRGLIEKGLALEAPEDMYKN